MDCSWDHGLNKACDGGDYDAAMDYLKELGGVIGEDQYEYLGADAFCKDKNISTNSLTDFEVKTGLLYKPDPEKLALNLHGIFLALLFHVADILSSTNYERCIGWHMEEGLANQVCWQRA